MCPLVYVFFLFLQAEDGIRDGHVTGVQTCALPILKKNAPAALKVSGLWKRIFPFRFLTMTRLALPFLTIAFSWLITSSAVPFSSSKMVLSSFFMSVVRIFM